jgi:hypothetical protein
LDSLRSASDFTARQSRDIQLATERLQALSSVVSRNGAQLDAVYGEIGAVLGEIEQLKDRLESGDLSLDSPCDLDEMEELYSASYTTENEREILRAALMGAVLPESRPSLAGNEVELF